MFEIGRRACKLTKSLLRGRPVEKAFNVTGIQGQDRIEQRDGLTIPPLLEPNASKAISNYSGPYHKILG